MNACRILVLGAAVRLAAPAWAQLDGFGPEQLIKYTPNWTGERFPDGRPKVPDELIERLKKARITSEEAAWGSLRIHLGYQRQREGNWLIPNRNQRLIGRAFTCPYMPGRPEVARVIEDEARAQGLSQHNVRVMDLLQPGDLYGRIGMRDPALQAECVAYVRDELKRRGLKPPKGRKAWTTRSYCGAGCFPLSSAPAPGRPAR